MKNTTALAVFIKDNKILLEKRKDTEDNYAGLWAFPGGHKEANESIVETLRREMKEELGIEIIEHEFIDSIEDLDPTSKEIYTHNAFLCKNWTGDIKETTEEEKLEWFDIHHLPQNVSNPVKKLIKEIAKF